MDDSQYMMRALALAELGRGSVSPNPMVGCVIVYKEKIIGEGFHQKYGEAHAEVNAVKNIKNKDLLKDSTVYVTLEPCAHHGKTPPCADFLVEKKVKKIIIACNDPFEQVAGKGIEKLRSAGIEVQVGILEEYAKKLNVRFFTSIEKERPFIILKWAQTHDGFLARENFNSKWISGQYSRQLVHKWRSEEDAILVGKNTAIHDNPSLTTRQWKGKNPIRVLLDSNLKVRKTSNLFNTEAQTLIINSIKEEKEGNIEWIKTELNNPWSILTKLHEKKIQSVIIEGGMHVLNSFIHENCWDKARIFISQEKFGRGIRAPEISGKNREVNIIFNDQLIIYQNDHA